MDDEVHFLRTAATVTFTPVAEATGQLALPFYYPNVRRYGFHLSVEQGSLECIAQFWPSGEFIDTMRKICPVTLALLKKWGESATYEKRVQHDQLVDPLVFYAKYQALKQKHKHWVDSWEEATDPQKFVFEDIGIAAFCICLFERDEAATGRKPTFLDLGCGNGFLVYLLTAEGYLGWGLDVARRKIWDKYPDSVRLAAEPIEDPASRTFPGTDWLLGNHTDELTPWLPVIAAHTSADTKFFLLPCCLWDFDKKYSRKLKGLSGYQSYLVYVKQIIGVCGFQVEEEALRIPSTKNVAFVGRRRTNEQSQAQRSEAIGAFLETRGYSQFTVRKSDRELTRLRFAREAARKEKREAGEAELGAEEQHEDQQQQQEPEQEQEQEQQGQEPATQAPTPT